MKKNVFHVKTPILSNIKKLFKGSLSLDEDFCKNMRTLA